MHIPSQSPPGCDRRACTASTLQACRVVLLLCPRLPNICAIQKLRCGFCLCLRALRARRDRPGTLPCRLPNGVRGPGVQASRSAASRRAAQVLNQSLKNRSHPAMKRVVIGLVVTAIRVSIAIALSQSGFPRVRKVRRVTEQLADHAAGVMGCCEPMSVQMADCVIVRAYGR